MLKEAIAKIEELSKPAIHTIGQDTFAVSSDGTFTQIRPCVDAADCLPLHSLDALVHMVLTEALCLYKPPIYIEANGSGSAICFLQPSETHRNFRQILYSVKATDVPEWDDDISLTYELALIAVRTRFQPSADTEYLLKLLSEISNGAKITCSDNGIATTVVTQKGIALQSGETIRPIVTLNPYRTFQEIDQPGSLFHIRISEKGIRFIEADGGMWNLEARRTIVKYLTERLKDAIEQGNVVVML